ncbi:MAG: biotin/lipoyl-binding protein [Muribaculaceae bacterium]|nr:biotin/lipoyl-binding protein [Muribaculaceae bacterium]
MKEYKYKINGHDYEVKVGDIENNIAHLEVNGVPYSVELEEEKVSKPVIKRAAAESAPAAVAPKPAAKPTAAADGDYVIASPLPGVIKEIYVKEGQQVKASDVVCILEAMKMGNEIHAGKDGVVKSIQVGKDESVLEGTTIMIIG